VMVSCAGRRQTPTPRPNISTARPPNSGRSSARSETRPRAFLLATPIILAAGVYKLPDLLGPMAMASWAAYLSVRFLSRYFTTRTLTPFAIYCLVAGALAAVRFALLDPHGPRCSVFSTAAFCS
jgi:drug/metabolite transporter (DMT)-like permease